MRQRAKNDAAAASQPESVAPAAPFYTIPWRLIKFLLQPFVIVLGSRAARVIALYLSIVYAYLFLLATTLATVYRRSIPLQNPVRDLSTLRKVSVNQL